MTRGGQGKASKNVSSLALTVWKFECFESLEKNYDSMNEINKYEGVCRTALVTPGVLIIPSSTKLS